MPNHAASIEVQERAHSAGASAPLPPSLEAGALLHGTYRIRERLASGGMGEVYAASHERLVGRFAVKVLQPEMARDRQALARFGREAVIMSGLQHPHVAQVLDFNVTDDGKPYLVMELLEGRLLQEVIDEGRPLPVVRVASIVRQIASALAAAHARGVIHRDLKPENIMLVSVGGDDEPFVKVFDFGISKVKWSKSLTHESSIIGTPEYMSPEQALGRVESIDHAPISSRWRPSPTPSSPAARPSTATAPCRCSTRWCTSSRGRWPSR
jgi:serine/threonine-protein kinase